MDKIFNDKFLISKYDTLQLMVYCETLILINNEMELKLNKYINNSDDIKNIFISIWVSDELYGFFCDLKRMVLIDDVFKYKTNFTLSRKMNGNQYKIYNISIKISN